MDTQKLNQDLIEIIHLKNALKEVDYSDKEYDRLEEQLHDKEDEFLELFGDYLERTLKEVHRENFPHNDVLLPIAYLANEYIIKSKNGDQYFDVPLSEGVIVETNQDPLEISRLVMLPNPVRLLLQNGNTSRKELWRME